MAKIFTKVNKTQVQIDDDNTLDFGDEDFTWMTWVKSVTNVDNEWIQKGGPERDDTNYNLRNETGMVSGVSASDGVPGNETISNLGNTPSIGDWVHAGGDHDESGSSINVFVNGNNPSRKTVNNIPVSNTDKLILGRLDTVYTEGEMAWVSVWRKKVSQLKKEAMRKGINPFVIDPDETELYMPLIGDGGGILCVWGLTKDECIENFASYTTQAEADACWVATTPSLMEVDITQNRLEVEYIRSNTNHSIAFDLGLTLAKKFVCRYRVLEEWDPCPADDPGNNPEQTNHGGIGISSRDHTKNTIPIGSASGGGNPLLFLGWKVQVGCIGSFNFTASLQIRDSLTSTLGFLNGWWQEGGNLQEISRTTYYEMRWDYPNWSITDYTDAAFTIIRHSKKTLTAPEADNLVDVLRYFVCSNRLQTGMQDGLIVNNIDDIQIWDGVADLDELSFGDYLREPDWSGNKNHAQVSQGRKSPGNPPVNLIQNYLS